MWCGVVWCCVERGVVGCGWLVCCDMTVVFQWIFCLVPCYTIFFFQILKAFWKQKNFHQLFYSLLNHLLNGLIIYLFNGLIIYLFNGLVD